MKTLKKVSMKVQRMPISCFLGWISSFSVIPEISSLGVFFGKRSSLLIWQKGNFIFVGKRNITFTNIQKTSYFHVFFEKYHLSFSVRKKNIIFSGKRNAIFPHDIRKIIFQCNFFGKTIFSEHLEKENMVFCAVLFIVNKPCHVPHTSRITTWGTIFTEIPIGVSKGCVRYWSHASGVTNVKTFAKKHSNSMNY